MDHFLYRDGKLHAEDVAIENKFANTLKQMTSRRTAEVSAGGND